MKYMPRRRFLQSVSVIAGLFALPRLVFARATEAFQSDSVDDVIKALLDGMPIEDSSEIKFKMPDIAENGAVVPVRISTTLADVDQIYLIIEKNRNPLSAVFKIGPKIVPDVSTRVKVGESTMARVIVRAGGRAYQSAKEVKVTIGGCGG